MACGSVRGCTDRSSPLLWLHGRRTVVLGGSAASVAACPLHKLVPAPVCLYGTSLLAILLLC